MNSCSDIDRLSGLPKNVIEAILIRLPICDAVRTSMLSRVWRYAWSTLSKLVIDNLDFPIPRNLSQKELDEKIVKIVDHVLLLHHGPIYRFRLSVDLESCSDIYRWVLFLSRNGIKVLILQKFRAPVFKLPSCIFSCENLTYLQLYNCKIIPPTWFKGFSRLTGMRLTDITFNHENGLTTLISLCPHLNTLEVRRITGCSRLKISAEELVNLMIEGTFNDIHFENTPLLATVSIKLSVGADCRIDKVLGHAQRIHQLDLLGHTLRNFATGDVPIYLPALSLLKKLSIHVNFEDMQCMLATCCIFRSSLVMETLHIMATSDKNTAHKSSDPIWQEGGFNCTFSRLQAATVTNFTGVISELKLIEYILANAPVLERLQVNFKNDLVDVIDTFRELIQYPRLSPKAKVIVPKIQLSES